MVVFTTSALALSVCPPEKLVAAIKSGLKELNSLVQILQSNAAVLQSANPVSSDGLAVHGSLHGVGHVGSPVDVGSNNVGVGASILSGAVVEYEDRLS